MCWQVYFLHNVEETWIYGFWLTQSCLRRCRHAGDDTVTIQTALQHCSYTHITCHWKQTAVFFGGKQKAITRSHHFPVCFSPKNGMFKSLQNWTPVSRIVDLKCCMFVSKCHVPLLTKAQLSPMSSVVAVPDIRQCSVLGLETPVRCSPCFWWPQSPRRETAHPLWESQMGMIVLITRRCNPGRLSRGTGLMRRCLQCGRRPLARWLSCPLPRAGKAAAAGHCRLEASYLMFGCFHWRKPDGCLSCVCQHWVVELGLLLKCLCCGS